MTTVNKKLLTKSLPIIFIFLLTIVFFYPVFFHGKTFYAFDTLFEYLPWSSTATDIKAHNRLITDPVNIFYTYNNFVKKCLDLKILSGWNNANFCGQPSGVPTHPVIFFSYLLFSQTTAHDFILWIHLICAGLFMFLYLRQINLQIYPALFGAVAWMFNGYVMVWFEFENVLLLAAPFVAALYFFELWLKTRIFFHCLLLACAISLSISTGYAHLIIYQFLFLGFYFLYRYFLARKNSDNFQNVSKKEMAGLALASILTLCILSDLIINNFNLLSSVQKGSSQRREFSFKELYKQTGEVPAKYLTTLIFPDFFGNPAGKKKICFTPRIKGMQPYNNYNELCLYAGVLTLFLALICIPYLGKKKFVSFYFFVCVLTLTMSMGSILYYPLARFVPGLNLSTPTRILYIFGFSMCVLAGIGADILMTIKDKKKGIIVSLWSLLLGAVIALSLSVQTETGVKWAADSIAWSNWDQLLSVLQKHFSLSSKIMLKPLMLTFVSFFLLTSILFLKKKRFKNIFLSLAILLLAYDLISFGLFYNTASSKKFEFPETGAISFLKNDSSQYRIMTFGNFFHNSFAPFNIQDIGGYASFYPKQYGEFLHLSQYGSNVPFSDNFNRWIFFRTFGSPLLDLINTKYLLLPSHVSQGSDKLKLVYDNEIKIYENRDVFERVFFVTGYEYCDSKKSAYRKISTYNLEDFREKVILLKMPPVEFIKNSQHSNKAETSINIISYNPEKIEMDVKTDKDGFLIISDNYHPSWIAKVDGKETEIFCANYIMRTVPIKIGSHKLILTFHSKSTTAWIVFTGWLVLSVMIVIVIFWKNDYVIAGLSSLRF